MLRALFYGALGALAAYFFDPDSGRRRRARVRDRLRGFVPQVEEKPQTDDFTLARKVETEIFRDADVPKGQINVNAENGVVVLRGEVGKPELIRDLEEKTRNVQGVREVENLLSTPKATAKKS
jgi:osmotically-inducible protein OsmY